MEALSERMLLIKGGSPLRGELVVQGSKNAALPILSACLLHSGVTVLRRVPNISDVETALAIMRLLGARIERSGDELHIDTTAVSPHAIPEALSGRIRASVLFIGSLLARFSEAELSLPGGCAIGERPVNWHLSGLSALGAVAEREGKMLRFRKACLKGKTVQLPFPSVGATQQLLLAASGATGETRLLGASVEPEVTQLCRFMEAMGIRLRGIGTRNLTVYGKCRTRDAVFSLSGDRIVSGTWLAMAAATRGELLLREAPIDDMSAILQKLRTMGCRIYPAGADGIRLKAPELLRPIRLTTAPHPGFPTDMQPVIMALACFAVGESRIYETIFESRMAVARELSRMGAKIEHDECRAKIFGPCRLQGAQVQAEDLRGGASLVLAALAASGESFVMGLSHLERGYEKLPEQLRALGACIEEDRICKTTR